MFFKGLPLAWTDYIPSAESFKVQDVPLLSKHAPQNTFKVFQICCFTVTDAFVKSRDAFGISHMLFKLSISVNIGVHAHY